VLCQLTVFFDENSQMYSRATHISINAIVYQHSHSTIHRSFSPCLLVCWRCCCCCWQAHPNSIALFVPAEITTYCFYPGKVKDYLVANAIFRMGGAAVLMTNKPSLVKRCKYQLTHAVRVHTGQDDAAYRCGAVQ
jgi:hypothetical protein